MSEKPNSVAIGAFVLGALLIGVTAIIFALGTGVGRDSSTVVMVFEGSVKGLNVGAPVALRGVQIGQVTKVELLLEADTAELIMLVESQISGDNIRRSGTSAENLAEELIARGLRAQLNTQSLLTGLLYVQLDFHPDSALVLAPIDSPYLQIPTIPTDLQRLTRKLDSMDFDKVAGDLESIASGMSQFVNNADFQRLPGELQGTLAAVNGLSAELSAQLASTGPRMDALLDGATDTVDLARDEIPQLAELVNNNLALLEDAMKAFEQGLVKFQGLVDYDSATIYELNKALRELGRAGRTLQQLGQSLEEQPESIIRGRSGETE